MNLRIRAALAFVVGLVAFSPLFLMPTGLAAAPIQSGFIMQNTDGRLEVWLPDSTGVALGFDFDLPGPGAGWKIVGLGDFNGERQGGHSLPGDRRHSRYLAHEWDYPHQPSRPLQSGLCIVLQAEPRSRRHSSADSPHDA
jgi:hypothetical protein